MVLSLVNVTTKENGIRKFEKYYFISIQNKKFCNDCFCFFKRRDYVIRNNEKILMFAKQNTNNLIILKT